MKAVQAVPELHLALQLKDEFHAFNEPLADFAYPLWSIDPRLCVLLGPEVVRQTVKILIYFENLVDSVTALPLSLTDRCTHDKRESGERLSDRSGQGAANHKSPGKQIQKY